MGLFDGLVWVFDFGAVFWFLSGMMCCVRFEFVCFSLVAFYFGLLLCFGLLVLIGCWVCGFWFCACLLILFRVAWRMGMNCSYDFW